MSKTIIIGAGLSGLILANMLKAKGLDYLVVEKSKGLGGRVSTRRIDGMGFDHGAPYLNHDDALNDIIETAGVKNLSHLASEGIYFNKGMNVFPKALSPGILIEKNCKIISIGRVNHRWELGTESGIKFLADKIVLTAPLPQSLELLSQNNISFDPKLYKIKYHKALIALIKKNSTVFKNLPPEIESILPMQPRDLHPEGFVVRATSSFSSAHFELNDDEILNIMKPLVMMCFKDNDELTHLELKKWRYALPQSTLPIPFVELPDCVYLIGDAFLHPDSRGAVLSAIFLAKVISQ